MEQISTIGIDIAKTVFQVHGIDGSGEPVVRRQLRRRQVLSFFCKTARLSYWHGSLRHITPLGARACEAGPRGAADATALCEALREAQQE
jgi:transposase